MLKKSSQVSSVYIMIIELRLVGICVVKRGFLVQPSASSAISQVGTQQVRSKSCPQVSTIEKVDETPLAKPCLWGQGGHSPSFQGISIPSNFPVSPQKCLSCYRIWFCESSSKQLLFRNPRHRHLYTCCCLAGCLGDPGGGNQTNGPSDYLSVGWWGLSQSTFRFLFGNRAVIRALGSARPLNGSINEMRREGRWPV